MNSFNKLMPALLSLILISFFAACGSSDPQDSAETGSSSIFNEPVGSGPNGGISIDVQDRLSVGETSSLIVRVRNADGAPSPKVGVVCGAEAGVSFLGGTNFITDSSGIASGIVGCNSPGSFAITCRLSGTAGLRHIVTVVCRGDVGDFADFGFGAGDEDAL